MSRTPTKTNLKPNQFTAMKTLLVGCVNVLEGIVEMFPEHSPGIIPGENPAVLHRQRGRPKGNVQQISGKKAA